MRLIVFIALCLLSLAGTLRAQPGDEDEDWNEDWTLDSLDPEDFDFDTEQIYHLSRGWFPTPTRGGSLSLSANVLYADVHDRTSGLRTEALKPTTAPFDRHDPYACGFFDYFLDEGLTGGFFGGCEERTIRKANSDEATDERFPRSGFFEIGLRFLYHLPFPAVLRAEGAYRSVQGVIFSEDTSRSYLSLEGLPRSFREIGVVHHQQYGVSGAVGLQIPVYGVFFDSDFGQLGSYYYIYGGIGGDYGVATRTLQYSQIADAKDQIRYRNGQDTVTLMLESNTDGINRLRTSVEGAIGWNFTAEFIVLGFEAFISAPTTSLVSDGDWKEYYAGFRFNIGYQWGTRMRNP